MAESIFSYSLTRPYPYKWFTWAVFIGGVIFTFIFSGINFAAYGYELSVTYTTNPNSTFSDPRWLRVWPFKYANKVSVNCESRDIPIGSQFFTNKLSLLYTLQQVWTPTENGNSKELLPSLTYLNNTLEDCHIQYIQIELLAEDRTAEEFGWCQWGPSISAMAVCSVANSNPPMMINLTTQYDLLSPTVGNGQQSQLLTLDQNNKASLWWGASLISAYWIKLSARMQDNRATGSPVRKGSINLQPSTQLNISSDDYFTVNYHFISETSSSGTVETNVDIVANSSITIAELIRSDEYPIWDMVDRYGKSFHSTVLADLGQSSNSSNNNNNILTDPYRDMLQNYSTVIPNIGGCNAKTGPATSTFDLSSPVSLSVTNSTIMQQYLCQIPKQKSTGTLIVAILSADLVFLQALWQVFNLITTWCLERSDRTARYCAGAERGGHGYELVNSNKNSSNMGENGDGIKTTANSETRLVSEIV